MKISFARWLVLPGLVLACACSDGDGEGVSQERASILNLTSGQIATFALSDTPSADFVAARQRVQRRLPAERVSYSRGFALGPNRGAAMVSDVAFRDARTLAARALGTTVSENKAADAVSAQASIDTLLAELIRIAPGASSCGALPAPKSDSCALALIILEVLRSEGTTSDAGSGVVSDAGAGGDAVVPVPDSGFGGGTDAGPAGPVNLFSCGTRDLTGAYEPKSSSITASETWSGKVLLKSAVTVTTAATLTIMPGTEIYMDVDSSLEIGWNNSEAAILAEGTPAAPIRFCGKIAEKGYWGALTVGTNVTSNSVLRNVLISDGAGSDVALELLADITIDNVQVRNAEKDGVLAFDFKEGSRQLSVEGVGGSAVAFTGEGALTRFPLGGMLLNNASNEAVVRISDIAKAQTLHNIGIPYVQENNITHRGGELTFEAGVDYRFKPDKTLSIGWNNSTAGVHINGTAALPVKFGAWQVNSSQWGGLEIGSNVTTNSNLTNVEIRQAGSNGAPALEVGAAILLDGVKLEDNVMGVEISKLGLATGSKNLTITKTMGRPLAIDADGVFSLPQGGSYTGNAIDQIEVKGTAINKSGTIADPGVPYYFTGTVNIMGGSNIVVAPGTDFVMGTDALLNVGWNRGTTSFIANGTAAAPITFTGLTPTAGSWIGISVESNVLSNSLLNYVQIGHAGGTTSNPGGALELAAAIPVTNCKFYLYAGYGITKPDTITTDYAPTNMFDTVGLGPIGKN